MREQKEESKPELQFFRRVLVSPLEFKLSVKGTETIR